MKLPSDVGVQYLRILASALAVGSCDRCDRRIGIEVKRRCCQAANLTLAEAGPGSQNVHHCPIRPRNVLDRRSHFRRIHQPSEFVGQQRPTIMATVELGILHREMSQWVVIRASIAYQPSAELLYRPEMMVAGLDGQTVRAKVCQTVHHIAAGLVANHFPSAGFDNSLHLEDNLTNMLFGITLVEQISFPVVDMLLKRFLVVLFKRINETRLLAFDLFHQLIQHRLRRGLVRRERNPTLGAVLITVTSPPLLRLRLHAIARLGVGYPGREALLAQLGIAKSEIAEPAPPEPPKTETVEIKKPEPPKDKPADVVSPPAPPATAPPPPTNATPQQTTIDERLERVLGAAQTAVTVAQWLGITGATGGVGGLVLGGLALLRTRRRARRGRSARDPPVMKPPVVTVDTPPPPQAIVPETRFAPYERDTFAEAFAWAETEMARKYPGAVGTLESLRSLIDQYLVDGGSKWRRGAVEFGGAGLVKVSERCVAVVS